MFSSEIVSPTPFSPVETRDGSSTFYSDAFGEWFHNLQGACNEAKETYVKTAQIADLSQQRQPGDPPLKILDICYGLGYNTAAALDEIWMANGRCPVEIKALEIDISVAQSAIAHGLVQSYSEETQQILSAIATEGSFKSSTLSAQILLGDAREQIQSLIASSWQADIIFLDPFSPPRCPQLWTVEFLARVAQCLEPTQGLLVTYSCAAAVRAALLQANLLIGSVHTTGRRWPGTVACSAAARSKHVDSVDSLWSALSLQESEHLQTRAAVPYRDPSLQGTAEEILQRRTQEQAQSSTLLPTRAWRQKWHPSVKR